MRSCLRFIQIGSTTGVLIVFLVLYPQLVLLIKARIIFRLLNEVCIQTTFEKGKGDNGSRQNTAIESLQTCILVVSLPHYKIIEHAVHKIIEHAEDGSMLLL